MSTITSRQKIKAIDSNVPIILVVEDDVDNLLYISHALILLEYNFITATKGQEALDLATKYEVDLVLMDLVLPDIDGIEVIDRLKHNQHTKNVPIIAITALVKTRAGDRAKSVGCDDYLEKPYLIDDLQDKIRTYLPQPFLQQTRIAVFNWIDCVGNQLLPLRLSRVLKDTA